MRKAGNNHDRRQIDTPHSNERVSEENRGLPWIAAPHIQPLIAKDLKEQAVTARRDKSTRYDGGKHGLGEGQARVRAFQKRTPSAVRPEIYHNRKKIQEAS